MNGFSALQQATGIVPVATDMPLVFSFDNVISPQLCDAATAHILEAKADKKSRDGEMPWFDGDNIRWQDIADPALKAQLYAYRLKLTQLASQCFQTILYPTFTDLVLWRPGRSQDEHIDMGYDFPKDNSLAICAFSAVTYLNDGFEGGETFVRGPDDVYHVNTPKKGSALLFTADDRTPHGVLEVKSGLRVTLPMWFTDIAAHCERENGWVVSDGSDTPTMERARVAAARHLERKKV